MIRNVGDVSERGVGGYLVPPAVAEVPSDKATHIHREDPMTIQDLGALGELIGSVAVLATLIYLTLQTRQNTAAISAQVDAARVNASLTTNLSIASSGEILKAMEEDLTDASTDAINQIRLEAIFRAVFYNFQWQFV